MATTSEKVEKIVKIVREETQADIVQKISSEFCIPVDEILKKIQKDTDPKTKLCKGINKNKTPCNFNATCGEYCKKHITQKPKEPKVYPKLTNPHFHLPGIFDPNCLACQEIKNKEGIKDFN